MEKFKLIAASRFAWFIAGAVIAMLVALPFVGSAQDKSTKSKEPEPQAPNKDSQLAGDKNLADQIAEMHTKVAKLEALLKQGDKGTPPGASDKGNVATQQDKTRGEQPNRQVSAKFQNCLQCHQARPTGPLPASHLEIAIKKDVGTKQDGMAAMGDNKTPEAGKGMGMMGGKGMGMMGGKGMGAMGDQKKADGMGMMGGKGMGAKGVSKPEMNGSINQPMMQQMLEMKMEMLEIRMELLDMKMKWLSKGMVNRGVELAADPGAHQKVVPSATPEEGGMAGMKDKTPDSAPEAIPHPHEATGVAGMKTDSTDAPKSPEKTAVADKDLPSQVRELQSQIAALEAALKQRPNR